MLPPAAAASVPATAAAQSYFLNIGGPSSDPDGLDDDGDGIACESNPCPCNHSTMPTTPTTPTAPYGWHVRTVRFSDLTGDGRRASRIFKYTSRRQPPAGYAAVVFVKSRVVISGSGLPQIETREFLLDNHDANCCPSAYRVTRHRWNGERIAPVPGSTRIEP
jgi:hypothetical protein